MFLTLKSRILLGVYIFIILSIPLGAFLVSKTQTYKSSASEGKKPTRLTSLPSTSPNSQANQASEDDPSSPTLATNFGPTLSLKVELEGRPKDSQATKLFIGLLEGELKENPKYLLTYSVDLSKDGTYSNISLAGLNPGSKYTALLKGSAQIATSSAFVMSPTVTNLNNGEAIPLITGDLNDDNVINDSDYAIAQKAYRSTSSSSNWNENADFNKDGIINLVDLAFITRHLGQAGPSGVWTSTPPVKTASASGSLTAEDSEAPTLQPPNSSGGYWIWIPQ